MVRKRKVISKPVVVFNETLVAEDLPLIQEVEPESNPVDEFHDPCADLEMDRGVDEMRDGSLLRTSPKSVRWAEEVEGTDYQSSAKDVWSKFKSNQVLTPSTRLNFTEPLKVGDQIVARLDMEEVEIEASFWKNAIVCIVLGVNPPFRVFEGFVKRVWGNLGVDKIVRMHSGFTLVNFRDEASRDLILETSVIHFDKKPVVLRPWTTDMDSIRMVKFVPVWIRLNGLGLQYWGKNSLSALIDGEICKVLVDMEISDHPPKSIAYINEREQLVEQLVEYEWLPSKCSACAQLGHIVANCNKDKGVVWKKKATVDKGEKPEQQKNGIEIDQQQPSGSTIPENRVHNSTSVVADERKKSSYKGLDSKENNEDQGIPISSQLDEIGSDEIAGNWITPKRRGPRQAVAAPTKADAAPIKASSSNGYAVLQEIGDGLLVTNSTQLIDGSFSITSGRILVIWQAKFVKVEILLEDPQLVHCKIKVCGQQEVFFATVVYGSNSMGERKTLWDKLASIGQLNNPWIIFGDFNAMFSFQDRNGGRQILAKDIADAQDWLALGQVDEFKCSRAHFTWSNKHDVGDRIFSKLDRVFTNDYWLDTFPKTKACFKWGCVSDHSYWSSTSGSGGGLNKIVQKLLRVKHVLKRFNREEVGDVVLDYKLAKEKFSKAQEALASNPSDYTLHQAVIQVQQKVSEMQNRYSSFLKQQSKVNWVNFSDENSRYFHAVMRKRRLENRITSFTIGDKIEDDYSKVVEHFLTHFENFMGRRSSATEEIDLDCLNQGNRLSLEHQVRLLRPFSKSYVKKALFSIHSSKSPGLDGFGSCFFKGIWDNIGDEISRSVLEFFQDGLLPKSLNETVISLIPKVADPKTASDYRPIACCNTLYKCISKMLCTRLSEVLPFLVHSNQGAFIKNRILAHNIMIFQDLLKGYTRKNISARCIMKIDLSKAYDTVDWHFVEELLKHLCFPSRFIDWILVCLKGTSYNLLMNGRIQGSFKGEKGLRQGDPMSPLLFVLIMEYLTRLLAHCSGKKGFGFHPMCKQLRLTNLCFADDLIIFCKGNFSSVTCIQEAFKKFCDSTGLSANKSKSHIFFGGVKEDIKVKILDLMQMEEGSFPLKYLGVHLRPTKWKASDCGLILDKLNKNLNCWASRNLSFAGRAQLIHSVLGIRNF
ncbi:uncharacterized protein LOC133814669 [Humulus lupulus]|uniref:uncharacterized protein LOC133814669 n=1 Tax=Humulus lupulus TaxID=3486 RepID=UPI002B406B2D|nr:uncharacterized protein LOC133814669 [Humulus lupulus]